MGELVGSRADEAGGRLSAILGSPLANRLASEHNEISAKI